MILPSIIPNLHLETQAFAVDELLDLPPKFSDSLFLPSPPCFPSHRSHPSPARPLLVNLFTDARARSHVRKANIHVNAPLIQHRQTIRFWFRFSATHSVCERMRVGEEGRQGARLAFSLYLLLKSCFYVATLASLIQRHRFWSALIFALPLSKANCLKPPVKMQSANFTLIPTREQWGVARERAKAGYLRSRIGALPYRLSMSQLPKEEQKRSRAVCPQSSAILCKATFIYPFSYSQYLFVLVIWNKACSQKAYADGKQNHL